MNKVAVRRRRIFRRGNEEDLPLHTAPSTTLESTNNLTLQPGGKGSLEEKRIHRSAINTPRSSNSLMWAPFQRHLCETVTVQLDRSVKN